MSTGAATANPLLDRENPWPGLESYNEEARDFFNGRTDDVAELLRRVRGTPLTLLYGKSGLGKSSLLQAGLAPVLRRERFLPVYIRIDVRDTSSPLIEQFATALADQCTRFSVEATPRRPEDSLWTWLHNADFELWSDKNQLLTPVFVLDQFEEVFTLGAYNQQAVDTLRVDLGNLAENRIPAALKHSLEESSSLARTLDLKGMHCRLLIALREDYLPHLESWGETIPSLMRNRMRLLPMNHQQAYAVVHDSAPHLVDEAVARKIVAFVAGAGLTGSVRGTATSAAMASPETEAGKDAGEIEPALLSLVCQGLNVRRQNRNESRIGEDLLEGSQEEILQGFYERSTGDLAPEVRFFVEDRLLTVSGYRDSIALENALSIPGVTQAAIDCLVDRRLVRKEERGGLQRLELTHDLLTGVISASRDRRRRLEMKAATLPLPYEGPEPYLFASYAHQDGDAVADVATLDELGFRVSYDQEIYAGAEWERQTGQAIKGCALFIVFVSAQSMNKTWVREAVRWAQKNGKRILPIFIEPVFSERGGAGTGSKDDLFDFESEGVRRYRFAESLEEYYAALTDTLPAMARKCAEDMDYEILGMGDLPDIGDIVEGKLSLTEYEQQQRRHRLVQKVRNTLQQKGRAAYSIETVFQLTSEETGAVENLSEVELREPSEERPSGLLAHPLNIGIAYIAPLRLVTGLITRLAQNWPPLVASYSSLVNSEKRGKLEELHYFVEFCWLAWGPSVLTTSLLTDDSTPFMVVQAAFGDEANSLPLIMRKTEWHRLVSEFQQNHDERILGERFAHRRERGWPVHLENLILVKPEIDPFFNTLCDIELFRTLFNKKTPDDSDKIALYLPSAEEGHEPGNASLSVEKEGAFYSTAYVWLMMEQDDDPATGLTPGRVIPFFEHANLATGKGLGFLQQCLARKALYHVLECEENPDYRKKGFYRFSTALFPDQMVEVLELEKGRLSAKDKKTVEKRFRISRDPGTWRSPAEVVRFADAVSAQITSALKARG